MQFLDAHTHVQFAAYEKDCAEVTRRALGLGVGMVNIGTQKDTSRRAVEVARQYESGVYAAVGLHPIHTEKSYHDPKELDGDAGFTSRGEDFDHEYYKNLALDEKVVAIGECGLDYFRIVGGESIKEKQKEAFTQQIDLAHEVRKPLMIHCRGSTGSPQGNAFADLIEILRAKSQILNSPSGIVHFFSGTKEDAEKLLDLGFSFTFGGVITFARDYDEVIKMIPLDRILSETDAPYVTPVPYRGQRNEPAYVVEVVKKLAEIKNEPTEKMSSAILANARRIFNL